MRFAVQSLSYLVPCIYAYVINRGAPQGGIPRDSSELGRSPPPTHLLHEQTQLRLSLKLDPYADKPRITFNGDGTFKLTIFSDVHFGENPWDAWGPEQDINTTALMKVLLKMEAPDYV